MGIHMDTHSLNCQQFGEYWPSWMSQQAENGGHVLDTDFTRVGQNVVNRNVSDGERDEGKGEREREKSAAVASHPAVMAMD